MLSEHEAERVVMKSSYQIVYKKSHYDLAEEVRELMKEGWQPQGGVYFQSLGFSEVWIQAMVK